MESTLIITNGKRRFSKNFASRHSLAQNLYMRLRKKLNLKPQTHRLP
jgi:hypothetical protein